ncbi:hypothetical protein M5689_018955 [Euphorbia peplus]|nr:hypothetical protein M5689_018955 [Euphorbia peplus]
MSQKNVTAPKKKWTDAEFHAFLDVCVRGHNLGHRSGGGWGLKGWAWVFNEMDATGHKKTRDQMRHKWDRMKLHWKLWSDLKGKETGLGWDPIKVTIDASDQWWKEKIQENESYAPLREKGIGQDVYEKYEILFMDTVATGEYAYVPSSGILPNDIEGNPIYNNVINLVQNNELGGSFEDELRNMMTPNSGTGGLSFQIDDAAINLEDRDMFDTQKNMSKNRKNVTYTSSAINRKKGDKGKKRSSTTEVTDVITGLRESIEVTAEKKIDAWREMFGKRPVEYSIEEVMDDVLSLPRVENGSEIHFFCGDLFLDKSHRDLYKTLKNDDVKIKWLEYKYNSKKQ